MKEIEEATELRAVLENPLDFIDSTDREEIISQIPDLFRKIAEMLFERYDILICDSKGKEHFYTFAEIEFCSSGSKGNFDFLIFQVMQ